MKYADINLQTVDSKLYPLCLLLWRLCTDELKRCAMHGLWLKYFWHLILKIPVARWIYRGGKRHEWKGFPEKIGILMRVWGICWTRPKVWKINHSSISKLKEKFAYLEPHFNKRRFQSLIAGGEKVVVLQCKVESLVQG